MTVAAELTILGGKPYKGPESYQSEDAHLFYGRDEVADQVIARMLTGRVTVLHSQSGAGKSSVLNAKVTPGLEARGWLPVRATPHDHPGKALREAMFHQLLPSPAEEALGLERAQQALGFDATATLADLLKAYDELAVRDDRRRALCAPVDVVRSSRCGLAAAPGITIPFIARLLRSSVDVPRFAEHIKALAGDDRAALLEVDEGTPLSAMIEALREPAIGASYRDVLDQLQGPFPQLRPFVENWWEVWASRHRRYAVVFILDQFEEMFTRYVDARMVTATQGKTLDWRIRDEYFEELTELYDHGAAGLEVHDVGTPLPLAVRYVIGMRSEYMGYRDRLPSFARNFEKSAYHLPLLTKDEARVAISEPAKHYGYTYARNVFDDILNRLAREERWVEPAQLQIVCERLWSAAGQALAADAASSESSGERKVGFEAYDIAGRADGILSKVATDFLNSLAPEDRLEAIEILEGLLTSSGTRNIVGRPELLKAPLRDPERRERLIERMEAESIVRAEWRSGGNFVEITHEFLIEPILATVRAELYGTSENARFVQARRSLIRTINSNFRSDVRALLTVRELQVLHKTNERVSWTRPAIEAMFRSAVTQTSEVARTDPDIVGFWRDRLALVDAGHTDTEAGGASSYDKAPSGGVVDREVMGVTYTGEYAAPALVALSPAAILEEYLTSPLPRLRGNALQALAILGDGDSVRRLATVAMGESDMAEDARLLVLELIWDARHAAIAELIANLDDPSVGERSYELLSTLFARGVDITLPPRPLQRRAESVKASDLAARKDRRRKLRWEAIGPGIAGGVLGLALVLLALLAYPDYTAVDETLPMLVGSLLLGVPPLVLMAAHRMRPVNAHVDQRAAGFVEILRAGKSSLVAAVVIGTLLAAQNESWALLVAGVVITVMMSMAVRAGTLVAYEAFTTNVAINRVMQTAVGAAAGMTVVFLGILVLSFPEESVEMGGTLVDAGNVAVVLCFALASVYARLETAVEPQRPVFGPHSKRGSVAIVLAGLSPMLLVAIALGMIGDSSQVLRLWPGGLLRHEVSELPFRATLVVPRVDSSTRTEIALQANRADTPIGPVALSITDSSGKPVDYSDEPSFQGALRAGTYALELRIPGQTFSYAAAERIFASLRGVLSAQDSAAGRRVPPFELLGIVVTSQVKRAQLLADTAQRLAWKARDIDSSGAKPSVPAQIMIAQAIEFLHEAERLGREFAVTAEQANSVCWQGALVGLARNVLSICRTAAQRAPSDPLIADSWALALLLTGQVDSAEKYFQPILSKGTGSVDSLYANRLEWIALARSGSLPLERIRRDVVLP